VQLNPGWFEEKPRKVHFFHDQKGASFGPAGSRRKFADTLCKKNSDVPHTHITSDPNAVTCKICQKHAYFPRGAPLLQTPPAIPIDFIEPSRLTRHHSIPMILHCPMCNGRHIDEKEFEHKPHHTHACQHCGHSWRPAKVNTHGVQFLPGFKNA
jgi:rubredoxin